MSESQTTFIMVKPDGVKRELVDEIIRRFESIGLTLISRRDITPSLELAETHYGIHKERPFFSRLCEYMCSGPIIVIELEKENAVSDFRKLIGSTNPEEAEEGTIRKRYASSIEANAIHGSDSDENAQIEIDFFFSS